MLRNWFRDTEWFLSVQKIEIGLWELEPITGNLLISVHLIGNSDHPEDGYL